MGIPASQLPKVRRRSIYVLLVRSLDHVAPVWADDLTCNVGGSIGH